MNNHFQILVWEEPPYFIAKCLDLGVASQGKTHDEALARLREAIEFLLEDYDEAVQTHKYEIEEIAVGV